ncbi:LOW QUALITY PROTEIN: thioredoxin-like protein AAED1 [Pomacea canaliculata]|uniref:LOW QUALITY PROTEIN: thioredoxin-like protein AAED1 n=1 Tax=Pomacea canaliculata TaxID=400727 RepID=UPI000D7335DA|nr:LOW QUALITY PROTEIN: thioredoxin-like protein AAED1 [Pomacea canaliculata]
MSGLLTQSTGLSYLSDVLSSTKTRLIFIGSSTPEQMAEYLQRNSGLFCGDLFTDPSVSLYKYFQLKKRCFPFAGAAFYWLQNLWLKGIVEGIRLAKETSHLAGDSWQQGGTLLLDKDKNVLYQHTEEHPADWPSMQEVLELVGIHNARVDYKKALDDWLKFREESRSKR